MTNSVAFTSGFFGLQAGHASRTACTPLTTPARPARRVVMKSDGDLPRGAIDFAKVNISNAGENLAGLVFEPDSESNQSAETRCDYGYTREQEDAVNRQINVEYTAWYAYHALWAYFDRDTVALNGFAKYFIGQSLEEHSHAQEFMEYQNKRGGRVELMPVAVPEMGFNQKDGTSDAVYAMDLHLQLEKFVYWKLKELHKVAEDAKDHQMGNFIEQYLAHQVDAIKTAADYVAQLKRVDSPHGVYHFNLRLLKTV
jgi:ferritin heavy chain